MSGDAAWAMAAIVSASVGIICASLGYTAGRRAGYQAGLAAALAIYARYVHGPLSPTSNRDGND